MRVLNRSLLLCPLVILDGYCLCVWCPVARSSWQSIWCLLEVLLEGLNRTALLVKCVEEVFGLVTYRRPSRESPRKSSSSVLRRPYTVEDPPGKKEEMHNFIELWSIGSAMYAKHQVSKNCLIVPLRNYLWCSASYLRTVFIKKHAFLSVETKITASGGLVDSFCEQTQCKTDEAKTCQKDTPCGTSIPRRRTSRKYSWMLPFSIFRCSNIVRRLEINQDWSHARVIFFHFLRSWWKILGAQEGSISLDRAEESSKEIARFLWSHDETRVSSW